MEYSVIVRTVIRVVITIIDGVVVLQDKITVEEVLRIGVCVCLRRECLTVFPSVLVEVCGVGSTITIKVGELSGFRFRWWM